MVRISSPQRDTRSLLAVLTVASLLAIAAACGGSGSSDGQGGAAGPSSSAVGAGPDACPEGDSCGITIECVCPDGTAFETTPCAKDGVCNVSASDCVEAEAAHCARGSSASGGGSGGSLATGHGGSGAGGSPSGGAGGFDASGSSSSGSGTGGYDPTCVEIADHECEVCAPNSNCKGSESWEFLAKNCKTFEDACPGYLECVQASSTCTEMNTCQQKYCS